MAKLYIPNLTEFLYDLIESKSKEYLFERLSREELKKVKSRAKIKTFVERAKQEDISILLSKLDAGFGWTIWDKSKIKKNCVKDVLLATLEVNEHDLTKFIIKSKIFSTTHIDIIRSLMVTSKASNSKTWSVNRKYTEMSPEKAGFKQRNILNKLDAERSLNWRLEFLSTAMELGPMLEHYKIEFIHFKILLFLQNSPNGATIDAVRERFLNPRGFKYMLNKLYKSNMIEYSPDKTVVTIDVHGMVVIDAIISKFP